MTTEPVFPVKIDCKVTGMMQTGVNSSSSLKIHCKTVFIVKSLQKKNKEQPPSHWFCFFTGIHLKEATDAINKLVDESIGMVE